MASKFEFQKMFSTNAVHVTARLTPFGEKCFPRLASFLKDNHDGLIGICRLMVVNKDDLNDPKSEWYKWIQMYGLRNDVTILHLSSLYNFASFRWIKMNATGGLGRFKDEVGDCKGLGTLLFSFALTALVYDGMCGVDAHVFVEMSGAKATSHEIRKMKKKLETDNEFRGKMIRYVRKERHMPEESTDNDSLEYYAANWEQHRNLEKYYKKTFGFSILEKKFIYTLGSANVITLLSRMNRQVYKLLIYYSSFHL